MTTTGSELLKSSISSDDDFFASIFRAVHFVAAKKEKPTEILSSPDKNKVQDITNIENSRSLSNTDTLKNENSPIPDGNADFTKLLKEDKPKTPFERFRGRYLIVTDFAGQLWCEQQLDYNFDPPPGVVITPKPQMAAGTDLHLARELEVQEIVEVNITSREDAFALKLLNLISCLKDLQTGFHSIRREIPIFGLPFKLDLFVVGVIDEVRLNSRSRKLDIVELKTRLQPRKPSRAQKKAHDLQVMLYRRMWNDLVHGQLTKADIIKHMNLTSDACLGDDICGQIRSLDILQNVASITMDALLDGFFAEMTSLPESAQLFVEYCHQETKECFAVDEVEYNETWLRQQLEQSASYWRGERSPRGVDIEEAWKCRFCDFSEVCAWRIKKHEECAGKNRLNFADSAMVLPTKKF